MKSHEADVKRGEGLAMGRKPSGAAHDKVVTMPKHDKAAQGRAQAAHERRENGGADPTGKCDCGM